MKRVLGIETSCDETAAAVVHGRHVESDVVHSQVSLHAPYGGVVPELASRDHLRNIRPVIEAALSRANCTLDAIDGIAVTCRPGLSGALLVGMQAAQGLAWAAQKPIVGVDHLIGHLLAVFLEYDTPGTHEPAFPFIGLLASGGHSALYKVSGPLATDIEELGATRDDAAGEAFDKVAKLLGLGYPGGPIIDKLAAQGDPDRVTLSKPMAQKSELEFSFSGLKTNVLRWVTKHGRPGDDQTLRDLCASFQRRVVDSLLDKALIAARDEGIGRIVIAGGVAANRELRTRGAERTAAQGLEFIIPPFRACTDNAAMIAYAGAMRLERGEDDAGRLEMSPHTLLPTVTRKGSGRRRTTPSAQSPG
ncbi:MAG TPA: tRNA (adenosine(37)-N6)-threonylcarbamoyltransferase complex transferase subunit TsaD [Polyangiaceae bacterium]